MTTAYTSLLGLALPVTGELSGTWGDTVNTAITSLLDSAVAGTTSITTDSDITLTTTSGASNQARQAIILWNPASGTTTRNITAPAQSKLYTVINASGGTQSIVFRGAGPTTGVTIVKGESALVAWNGSDFIKVSNAGGAGTFTNLTVTGNTILGDAAADTLTVNATVTSNLIFTDNTYDIGASGATRPRSLFLGTNLTVGSLTSTRVPYASTGGLLVDSANMTFNGTRLTVADLADSGLTSGRVTYASSGGALTDSANMTFDGTRFTVGGKTTLISDSPFLTGANLTSGSNALAIGGEAGNSLIGFFVNNSEGMRLTSTGLGIGTSSPAVKLQSNVSRTSGQNVTALVLSDTVTGAQTSGFGTQIQGWSNNGSAISAIGFEAYGGTNNDTALGFYTQTSAGGLTRRMTISSTGDVGIGTGSPSQKLHINVASGSVYEQISSGSNNVYLGFDNSRTVGAIQSNNALVFDVGGTYTERMRLDASGNLGLGVTPSAWGLLKAVQIGNASFAGYSGTGYLMTNAYFDGSVYRYTSSNFANLYTQNNSVGQHAWHVAASGTAGNAISFTQAMTLDASGNLGIGTTSPSTRLHAKGSGGTIATFERDASGTIAYFNRNTGGGNAGAIIGADSVAGYFAGGNSTSNMVYLDSVNNLAQFFTNGTERARIDSSGNVGIGTTSPVGRVESKTANMAAGNPAYDKKAFVANIPYSTSNITSSLLAAFDGSIHGADIGYAYNGSGYNLMFATNSTTSGSPTERARIDSAGRFLVNNTSSLNGSAYIQATGGPYPIWIQGSSQGYTQGAMVISSASTDNPSGRGLGVYMWNQGTTATWYMGTAYGSADNWFLMRKTGAGFREDTSDVALGWLMLMSSSGAGYQGNNSSTWSTTSDARVKDDVQTIENGLDVVLALRPVDFYNKVTKKREENFIAQEYEQVLAKHVTREKPVGAEQEFVTDEILRLNPNLVPYLVSAIQKLNAEIEALKATRN